MPTIPTPALLLDRSILLRNLERMRTAIARHPGVTLRPHLKTAKSAAVARLATNGGDGITVSTVAEAEYFADHGFRDILLAVATTPDKLRRLDPLLARGVNVTVLTDDLATAHRVAPCRALIEVDCGEERSGVDPGGEELLEIADALGSSLAGVLGHAGHSYRARGAAAFARVAEQERVAVVTAAERLRAAGHRVDIVSVGSTPTALHADSLAGVTEVRAGVYMFGDLFQAAIGSCTKDDIALSVLASVIGHRKRDNVLILDAGALALSKDRSTERTDQDAGFGEVHPALARSASGGVSEPEHVVSQASVSTPDQVLSPPSWPAAIISTVYQEHGLATCEGVWPWDQLPVGARVRILPNHACLTAAAHDRYHVIDGGEVVDVWERCRGW